MNESSNLRGAVRQQLATDRLLGVTFAPMPRRRFRAKPSARCHEADAGLLIGDQTGPRLSVDQKTETLRVLDETRVQSCRACSLHQTRKRTVFGHGNADARLVFVGEAPGEQEDRQGLPFVGRAGELLNRMIVAMGLTREEVYICNVLKCRPPENRDPSADEILACASFLREQLSTIQAEVVVALGAPASKTLLQTADSIGRLRGRFHHYYLSGTIGVGPWVPLMPTYHPAYLLRSPGEKRKTWDDLKLVMQRLNLPVPR